MAMWTPHHTTPRKDTRMIAVSFTLILALLVGYYLIAGPTIEEVEK